MEVQGNADSEENINDVSKKTEDMVAYASYKKVVGAKKTQDSLVSELKERLQMFEQKELESTGQKDSLIDTLRKEIEAKDTDLKKSKANFAWKAVSGEIKDEAIKQGCTSPDKLIRLLEEDDFNSLQVDDNYRVNKDDLNRLIKKAKKENADISLFGKGSVNIQDVPLTNKVESKKVVPLSEMSVAQIKQQYQKLHGV